MIYRLNELAGTEQVGNKAKFLGIMLRNGFQVPGGFVLDSEVFDEIVKYNSLEDEIQKLLQQMEDKKLSEISKKLQGLFEQAMIPDGILSSLSDLCDATKKYAVRSSGTKEDLEKFSFAGQYDTFLNVDGNSDSLKKAVLQCYQSVFSEIILSYLWNNQIPTDGLKMSVVIQEMVPSEISGVAFTVNPKTGCDKEILVEVAKGLGENLVSGKVIPEQYRYNWFEQKYDYDKKNQLLQGDLLSKVMEDALAIQHYFGYPCDIEFAIAKGQVYILQARAITKLQYAGFEDIWSTADFKDGGVSATVCTPYMWSLYEYIWEYTMRKFILDSKILRPKDMNRKLGDMFYGRPYWNMSIIKMGMSQVPGYKEREFDSEFGVKIVYEGDGQTTKITPKSLGRIALIALAQSKILKEREENAQSLKEGLLQKYDEYRKNQNKEYSHKEFEKVWYDLTKNHYLHSESTYFWQIFINTIHQSIYKDSLLKYVSESEYLSLLGGIDQISHLLPFYDMWNMSRKIRSNKEDKAFWENSSIETIKNSMNSEKYCMKELREFIENYGYHSDKELDVTYPCYYEDVETIIGMFQTTIALEDQYSPLADKEHQKEEYQKQLEKIKGKVSPSKYEKVKKKIEGMRKMLWWREEFRDLSTRLYYIIRIYTVRLAENYVKEGILKQADDIWYLKVEDLWNYMDGSVNLDDMLKILERNKWYYECFRNYMSENEIGQVFDKESKVVNTKKDGIYGIGCNNGRVTARARVIESLAEIHRIEEGDILITRFTDTGWTCKFAMLSGIVTEYGGILCHAAIVSREYGIPCIVCAHDILAKVRDGQLITIDGATGEVIIEKEQ